MGKERVDTKVRSDVFPAPLGPSRRNVGNAVREGDRKKRKCNRIGMERTTTMVMRMIDGVGSRREESMARGSAHDIFAFPLPWELERLTWKVPGRRRNLFPETVSV